jgi:hypothetical protein
MSDRPALGRSRGSRRKWKLALDARGALHAVRRPVPCDIWATGACSSRPDCSRTVRASAPRLPRTSGTIRKPPSAARSRRSWGWRPRIGASVVRSTGPDHRRPAVLVFRRNSRFRLTPRSSSARSRSRVR